MNSKNLNFLASHGAVFYNGMCKFFICSKIITEIAAYGTFLNLIKKLLIMSLDVAYCQPIDGVGTNTELIWKELNVFGSMLLTDFHNFLTSYS